MPFKLSYLNSNLALTLGYLNPSLNNSALKYTIPSNSTGNNLIAATHLSDKINNHKP